MTHFKATHEPFDYPDRHNDLYKDQEIPYPPSLFDRGPEETGRLFEGQVLENLGKRYTSASNGPWWCDYPGLPFIVDDNMEKEEARKKFEDFITKEQENENKQEQDTSIDCFGYYNNYFTY